MKKKISKRSIILSISCSLLVITGIIFACAGGDDFEDFYKSFFAPETSRTPEASPFYRSVHTFYDFGSIGDNVHLLDTVNINEWKDLFSGAVSYNDLNYLVYRSRIGEIDTCIFYLKNNSYPIQGNLKKNSVLAFSDKNLVKEFLFYLGYAKRCEPYASYVKYWWDDDETTNPRNDKESMQKLVEGGIKALINIKSSFIKERYAFQIIRMHYFLDQYIECSEYFEENKGLFISKNSIYYRTMGYAAAAYRKLEKFSNANYYYSIIFDKCPEMQKICYLSFHNQDEYDWEGSLELAKDDHEKEVLWALLGINDDPFRAMQAIYKLNPKSDLLNVLVVRSVNIEEESFLPDTYAPIESGYEFLDNYVDEDLLKFTGNLANAGNTSKPYLWNLVAGYLNIIKGNYKEADKYLKKAESLSPDDLLIQEQIRCFHIINTIEQYTLVNLKTEEELAKELKWLNSNDHIANLRYYDIYRWSLNRLSVKYLSWGDSIKTMCLNPNQCRAFYDSETIMTGLLAYIDSPNKSNFDKLLLNIHPYTKKDLIEYKAIKQIYKYNFREAIDLYKSCKDAGDEILKADPFAIQINDCHDCDFEAYKETEYTKYSFVERLLQLQDSIVNDPAHAPKYYFHLANGLYNMTYFGNARQVYSNPLISLSNTDFDYDYERSDNSFFDCSEALKYYNLATQSAKNIEFKTKCTFMAAKCEQNQYFCSSEYSYRKPVRSGIYFKLLKENYSKTKYYQEIIKECGYFRTYLSKN